jgi:hypothetical protein
MSATRKKKTVLRTIRLTQELDDVLRRDAQQNGVSINTHINVILTKYMEWDRFIAKFRFISIANETFQSILEEADDNKLENIASELGNSMPKAVTMFWFKELNLETFIKTISLFGKYSWLHKNEVEFKEGKCIITFHHELGRKWSTFLRYFISGFVKSAMGVVPQTDVTDNRVVVSFRTGLSKSESGG